MATHDVAPKPSRSGPQLTDIQRSEIIAKRLNGFSPEALAQEYNVNRATIWRICNKLQQEVKQAATDWRHAQTQTAISTINNGLRDDEWVRRGDLGVKVLTGLGVYKSGDTNVTVNNVFLQSRADLPRDWQERMKLVDTSEPALDVASSVIDTTTTQHD